MKLLTARNSAIVAGMAAALAAPMPAFATGSTNVDRAGVAARAAAVPDGSVVSRSLSVTAADLGLARDAAPRALARAAIRRHRVLLGLPSLRHLGFAGELRRPTRSAPRALRSSSGSPGCRSSGATSQ